MVNILVTGGSGFVGTNLIEYYATAGCNVLNIDIAAPRNSSHVRFWKKGDICEGSRLHELVHDFSPNIVLHMAARTDLGGASLQDYRANTDGVRSIVKAASDLPSLERVIFASSMLVCPLGYQPKSEDDYCPTTIYGESKVIGEQLVRSLAKDRFAWTILRPTSLWGPWFGVPYKNFFDAVAAGIYIHPKGRRIRRSYGFVLNAVHQIAQIASCPDNESIDSRVFYLADYAPVELFDWASQISFCFGKRPPREVPLEILRMLSWLGDGLKYVGMRNPPLSSFRLKNLLTEAIFDMRSLERVAGRSPYGVEDGVRLTVDWMYSKTY
jgi:nucleoside-diphosphate-sugar epimerase